MIGEFAILIGVISVAGLVGIDVGDRHQPDDDHARQDHAGHPGIEVHQHFLEPEEVPGGLGGVGSDRRAGRLFQGCLEHDSPDDQDDRQDDHADQLGVDQVGPGQRLVRLEVFEGRQPWPIRASLITARRRPASRNSRPG